MEAPFKRMSDVEMQMRHKKGLGYRCDEKYSIGHRCKLQELQVVVSREKEREPKINADEEARTEGSEEGDHVVVELSVNSVIRLSSPKSFYSTTSLFFSFFFL